MNLQKNIRMMMVLLFFIDSTSSATTQELNLLSDIKPPQQASEYIFRSSPQESLISVQLLGAVNKPGVYYVPVDTDLLKLLTLAGGSLSTGDVSELLVRKQSSHNWDDIQSKAVNNYKGAYEVDAEKIMKYGGASQLKLGQDDFVYVPQKSTFMSSEVSRSVTLVSVVMGIILSGLLIHRYSEQK